MKERIESVVDDIYQAAADASCFPRMFESLSSLLKASHGFFLLLSDRSIATHTYNLSPEVQRTYNDFYSQSDPWYNAAIERGVRGQVMTGQELMPTKELEHTDFYRDILVPDQVYDIMSVTIEVPSAWSAGFSFQRSRNEPFFEQADKALLGCLVPHLKRMIKLRRTFEHQACLTTLTEESADCLEFGVIILSDEGRISFANRVAERILTSGDGIFSHNGCLAARGADEGALSRTLAFALADDGSPPIGGELCIRRKSGRLPWVLQIVPIDMSGGERFVLTPAARLRGAVVVITDPEKQTKPSAALLQRMFGLTHTESAFALQLVEGKSVHDIADGLRIGKGTARWHLKNIQAKTDTHRQSDLVKLLAGIAPKMRRDD